MRALYEAIPCTPQRSDDSQFALLCVQVAGQYGRGWVGIRFCGTQVSPLPANKVSQSSCLPKRAGATERVLEKERAATACEHEAAKKACDEARGTRQQLINRGK
jgi:hypothetical protein